ncbi:hypothetical protein HYV71_03340 [Candidatus Uhrbacteria bacterium]|nr:hypothetical protein [Candidatus Uhrbacteria bacterium]
MPETTTKFKDRTFSWVFHEFDTYERGVIWYAVAGIVVAVFLIYSYTTENYLFGLLTIITTIIIFTHNIHNPQEVQCSIDAKGIQLGNKYYPYHALDSFSIIENDDGHEVLYVQEKAGFRSTLPIPLGDLDPQTLRRFLQMWLEEDLDHKYEPFWDSLARFLKL